MLLLSLLLAGATAPTISPAGIKDDVRALSSDAFAGRGPGEDGEAATLAYLERQFASAGLEAATEVDPGTVDFLKRKGLEASPANPRSVDQVPNLDAFQIIVALSPEAKRAFPKPTKAVCLDWSIADPSLASGTAESKAAAYEAAHLFLNQQISDLCEAVLGDKID